MRFNVSALSNMRRPKSTNRSEEPLARAIVSTMKSQSNLSELKDRLDALNGIYEVQIIALTNLFVRYDPKIITLDDIRSSIGK